MRPAISTLVLLVALATCARADSQCQSTFATITGNHVSLTFCVTLTGNIGYLSTGIPLLGAEGYALCGPGPAGGYWDLGSGGDSGNWLAPTITQPGGPGTFPLTIARTTADGYLTLTQSFAWGSAHRSVHVKMTVQSPLRHQPFRLLRYADVTGPDFGSGEHGDHAMQTSFVWNASQSGVSAQPAASVRVSAGLAFGGAPSDLCTADGPATLPYAGDAATLLAWTLDTDVKGAEAFDYVPIR